MIIPDNGHLTKITKGKYSEGVLYAENHILEEIKIYVQSNYHVVEMKLKPMYVISFIRKKMVSMNLMGIKKSSSLVPVLMECCMKFSSENFPSVSLIHTAIVLSY